MKFLIKLSDTGGSGLSFSTISDSTSTIHLPRLISSSFFNCTNRFLYVSGEVNILLTLPKIPPPFSAFFRAFSLFVGVLVCDKRKQAFSFVLPMYKKGVLINHNKQ